MFSASNFKQIELSVRKQKVKPWTNIAILNYTCICYAVLELRFTKYVEILWNWTTVWKYTFTSIL